MSRAPGGSHGILIKGDRTKSLEVRKKSEKKLASVAFEM